MGDEAEIEIYQGAAQILESDEHDLVRLASLSGCDVSHFYVGANFDNVDIRGCDLRALNLRGAKLDKVVFDAATKIDPRFVPPDWNLNDFKSAELTSLVYNYLSDQMRAGHFRTRTSVLRYLVRICHLAAPTFDVIVRWRAHILSQPEYKKALNSRRPSRKNMTIKVYDEEHRYVLLVGKAFHGRSAGYNAAAMIGMEIEKGKTVPGAPPTEELELFARPQQIR